MNFIKLFFSNLVAAIFIVILLVIAIACAIGFGLGISLLLKGVFVWYLPVSIIVAVLMVTLIDTIDEY